MRPIFPQQAYASKALSLQIGDCQDRPHVHTIRGDIGMFASGLHVPTLPIRSSSIVQLHSLDGHLNTSASGHKISVVANMPNQLKHYMGICRKGRRACFHCDDLGCRVLACSYLSLEQIRPPFRKHDVLDFTITLGIPHTPLYRLLLWMYVCLHRPDFLIKFEIRNLCDVLKHNYSWERVTSPVVLVHCCYAFILFL